MGCLIVRLYNLCKRIIQNTNYTSQEQKDEMQERIDVLYANGSFDTEKYNELTQLLANKPIA